MTDELDDVRVAPPGSIIGIEDKRTITVSVDQVVIGERRPINEAKVAELMESISSVGVLNLIVVAILKGLDGKETVRLVAGRHRLEAMKRLGFATVQCTVFKCDDALRIELVAIDENLVRHDLSPAEHAFLTRRRIEIFKKLAEQEGALSQNATPSKQALRGAGQKTGHDVASVRDQARRTGESKDKVARSQRRGLLGSVVDRVLGTTLDTGVELDALGKLPVAEREDLANRAASGEAVSARTADRKPKLKPKHKPKLTRREQAEADFHAWCDKYEDLDELADMGEELMALGFALAAGPAVAFPAPKRSAPASVPATQEDEPCATESQKRDAPNSNS